MRCNLGNNTPSRSSDLLSFKIHPLPTSVGEVLRMVLYRALHHPHLILWGQIRHSYSSSNSSTKFLSISCASANIVFLSLTKQSSLSQFTSPTFRILNAHQDWIYLLLVTSKSFLLTVHLFRCTEPPRHGPRRTFLLAGLWACPMEQKCLVSQKIGD